VTGKWLFWFDELCIGDIDLVGKKCANLGEMTRAKVTVPPGFALSLPAYQKFMSESGLNDEISQYVQQRFEGRGPTNYTHYIEVSEHVKKLIETKEMSPELAVPIKENYQKLCELCGIEDVAVAVRSSGPVSMPGAFETFLNVKGADDVVKHVVKVWASTFSIQSLAKRLQDHHPILIDGIGVAVLKMVNASKAGVAFTMHPTNMDAAKVVIEGTWGLGESVVSSSVNPDHFSFDKATGKVEKHINPKTLQIVYGEKGTQVVDVPAELQNVSCLSDEEINRVAQLALSVEKYYHGVPQDIEWVFDKDMGESQNLFLVQARNISVVKQQKSQAEKIADFMLRRVFQSKTS
jgi:pyruvate,water dikinase